MRPAPFISLIVGLAGIFSPLSVQAQGIIPDRINQVIIEGRFAQEPPAFLMVFSTKPLQDARGRQLANIAVASIDQLETTEDQLVLRLYGKPASKPGRYDYFFGTQYDAEMPWNNGTDFAWRDWEKLSPDIWDNICIMSVPTARGRSASPVGYIQSVTIKKGGKLLYDARATETYPNQRRFSAAFPPFNLTPRRGQYPVLNLCRHMELFRDVYYELDRNPILTLAYSDLGQTDKTKYANRGTSWCSEFASYVYRQNGILTPNPNTTDVHWKNMRAFFENNGAVYPARKVAQWPDRRKIETIKPGTFVSILTGENSTHSLIFARWVSDGGAISRYVGISGNNKGMVWAHAPLELPTVDKIQSMSPTEIEEFDQKVYFAVPPDDVAKGDVAHTQVPTVRSWTDATGRFEVEARFLGMTDDNVRLKKTDGSEISVPITRLSKDDQQVVRQLLKRDE